VFGFKQWFPQIFKWKSTVERRKYAIADGGLYLKPVLRYVPSASSSLSYVHDALDKDTWAILQEVARSPNPAAIWESKHLTVLDKPVMDEIVLMGKGKSQFAWKFCSLLPKGRPTDFHSQQDVNPAPETGKQTQQSTKVTEKKDVCTDPSCPRHEPKIPQMKQWLISDCDASNPPWRAVLDTCLAPSVTTLPAEDHTTLNDTQNSGAGHESDGQSEDKNGNIVHIENFEGNKKTRVPSHITASQSIIQQVSRISLLP